MCIMYVSVLCTCVCVCACMRVDLSVYYISLSPCMSYVMSYVSDVCHAYVIYCVGK